MKQENLKLTKLSPYALQDINWCDAGEVRHVS